MPPPVHPAPEHLFRQPYPPGEFQPPLDPDLQREHRHAGGQQSRERQQLGQEAVERPLFQRIEQPRAPEIQRHLDRDLCDGHQYQRRQPPAIEPFVLRRPERQNEAGEAPQKSGIMADRTAQAGPLVCLVKCHFVPCSGRSLIRSVPALAAAGKAGGPAAVSNEAQPTKVLGLSQIRLCNRARGPTVSAAVGAASGAAPPVSWFGWSAVSSSRP